MKPRYAIVVAGGQGLRMGTDIPKQFLLLGGRPILMHTLERFSQCAEIVLVLPQDQISYWHILCLQHAFALKHSICAGGATRYHSVLNGLNTLAPHEGLVAIHDGVRPFAHAETIDRLYHQAEQTGAALPYTPVTDSLRHRSGDKSCAVVRSEYIAVQTPQIFDLARLREAYSKGFDPSFTDDASVYEYARMGNISLVEGNVENIKITTAQDLATAQYILSLI